MGTRRDSRVSVGARQNDALVEFESFKKKFLLANKHITKLNSTLSVRIEELNAQISTLYVENLRLRASEIALAAQLKREKEKSTKVMADAEAATQNLAKHLSYLRQTLNIHAIHLPAPKEASPPHSPPRRPVNAEPRDEALRVARLPNVPGIDEEDEPPTDDHEHAPVDPPRIRTSGKARSSSTQIPLPSITPGLPRKKPSSSVKRRESGLLMEMGGRPGSPTVGSPVPKNVELEEDAEDVRDDLLVMEEPKPPRGVTRRKQKPEETRGDEDDDFRPPRRKQRDDKDLNDRKERKRKPREPDVDGVEEMPNDEDAVVQGEKEKKVKNMITSTGALDSVKHRAFLAPRPASASSSSSQASHTTSSSKPTNIPPIEPPEDAHQFFLPTPRASSNPPPEEIDDADLPDEAPRANPEEAEGAAGGRERRTRKSVNYAEPKLNTKMRKPDPPPGSAPAKPTKKRTSTPSVNPEEGQESGGGSGKRKRLGDEDTTPWVQATIVVSTRKFGEDDNDEDDDDDDFKAESGGEEADGEFAVRRPHRGRNSASATITDGWGNVDQSRRRSHSSSKGGLVKSKRNPNEGGFLTDWEERRHSLAM
ncbi:shugoshin family protein [Pleurotus pulmonarius]